MLRTMKAVAVAVALAALTTACSPWGMLDRALEHASEWRGTREAKHERGWRAPDAGLYVCSNPAVDVQLEGRTCALQLAPTVRDCLEEHGRWYHFRDQDGLSGMSRQPLFAVCQAAEVGQHFKDADGVILEGQLVVLDAGNGARDR